MRMCRHADVLMFKQANVRMLMHILPMLSCWSKNDEVGDWRGNTGLKYWYGQVTMRYVIAVRWWHGVVVRLKMFYPGACTPYKLQSKWSIENLGERILANLGEDLFEVNFLHASLDGAIAKGHSVCLSIHLSILYCYRSVQNYTRTHVWPHETGDLAQARHAAETSVDDAGEEARQ